MEGQTKERTSGLSAGWERGDLYFPRVSCWGGALRREPWLLAWSCLLAFPCGTCPLRFNLASHAEHLKRTSAKRDATAGPTHGTRSWRLSVLELHRQEHHTASLLLVGLVVNQWRTVDACIRQPTPNYKNVCRVKPMAAFSRDIAPPESGLHVARFRRYMCTRLSGRRWSQGRIPDFCQAEPRGKRSPLWVLRMYTRVMLGSSIHAWNRWS
jgi:hypothetical protein